MTPAPVEAALGVTVEAMDLQGPSPCWVVLSHQPNASGYIEVRRGTLTGSRGEHRKVKAHRVVLAMALGRDLRDGMHAGHQCHDLASEIGACEGGRCLHRRCVRPDHLAEQSPRDNAIGSAMTVSGRSVRRATCAEGHQLGGDNAYAGTRKCAACRLRYWRDRSANHREERRQWSRTHYADPERRARKNEAARRNYAIRMTKTRTDLAS